MDSGRMNWGPEMLEGFAQDGTQNVDITAGEAHEQLGRVENHGKWLLLTTAQAEGKQLKQKANHLIVIAHLSYTQQLI